MSLRNEMDNYTDGNALAAPNPVPSGVLQGSDNGPCFESEKACLLYLRNELSELDRYMWAGRIDACIRPEGLLCRVPWSTIEKGLCPNSQCPPDDLYAIFNAAQRMGNTRIPRVLLKGALKHFGFMNNVDPAQWTGQSFLFRQLQLLACGVSAAFPSWKNPLHILVRTAFAPCYWVAGGVLAFSCINEHPSSTDPRRLAWHLWHATRRHSLIGWIGGRIWYARLKMDYFEAYLTTGNAMRGVAAVYYHGRTVANYGSGQAYTFEPHPFAKYWID